MSPAKVAVVVLMAAAVAGCANDPYSPKQGTGPVAGAVSGAIGASLDERDRQRAHAAEIQALEGGAPGAPVGWRSEHTAYYGTIVPGPYYYSGGMRCRSYTHTVYIDGRPQAMRGTACRSPDGTWTAIG
jgi:surface antigen